MYRDVKGSNRTLEDFQEIARIIGGADIIVFQELGAKGFKKSGKNEPMLQVFNSITYTGFGSDTDFRTNLNIRKVAQMYDQFLVCKAYSSKMAHGNK